MRIKLEAVSMDSTIVKVSRWYAGPQPSASPVAVGPPRFIWYARTAITGQAHDAPEGRRLLNQLGHSARTGSC